MPSSSSLSNYSSSSSASPLPSCSHSVKQPMTRHLQQSNANSVGNTNHIPASRRKDDPMDTKVLIESNCSWIRRSLIEPFYQKNECSSTSSDADQRQKNSSTLGRHIAMTDSVAQDSSADQASKSDQIIGTKKLTEIQTRFDTELLQRAERERALKKPFQFPPRRPTIRALKHCVDHHHHHHAHGDHETSCSSDVSSSSDDDLDDELEDSAYEELQRKRTHPYRLHDELWYNESGEMNDGPLCRCSVKARRSGIRHCIYPGEQPLGTCNQNSDNAGRLHHYRLVIRPLTNFTTKFPTVIEYDGHDFCFEGFSLLAHQPIRTNYPACRLIRFNIEYEISLEEEHFPTNFTVRDLELFSDYLLRELLELVDLNWRAAGDKNGCPRFHIYPRFTRLTAENGKEFLSMHAILNYLLTSSKPVIDEQQLEYYNSLPEDKWIEFAKQHKGMIVTYPGMKPCSIRVDQLDRELPQSRPTSADSNSNSSCKASQSDQAAVDAETITATYQQQSSESTMVANESDKLLAAAESDEAEQSATSGKTEDNYPIIVHFGIRPPQLSYAGNPMYQRAWRDFVKYRHLLANKPKVTMEEKQMLLKKEEKLQEMRLKSDLKRDCTVTISTKGFLRTGIFCDIIQHALILPVIICHLRFHQSLNHLEDGILQYNFKDRFLLQLALTHPSYRENFGTNADHARNALTNCGIRQPYYGDRKVHFMNTRKRGINMLINIMSRFGHQHETASSIIHNERLEFLGDAVVEFLTSIHLYHIFPDLEEGGLATFRAAIVQNQHLAVMAKNLQLNRFMLYAHGSDLCHDFELKHAMANCFEALIGALFLDGGITVADTVFSDTLFWKDTNALQENLSDTVVGRILVNKDENQKLKDIWVNYKPHPIQMQEPDGDRHYIEQIPRLKELLEFEELTGIQFKHIRLLARAFTHRSVGFNNLTLGSNQRMEFLGDTVLQLIASDYLYKFFPGHHEGHLSLLRSSLVNNKTQAVVCDDLGMTKFAIYNYAKGELKTKDRADLLEAFLGALYVDKGLDFCKKFCETCFFPRLEHFIMNQDWNDPKSKLQQCCLTLRSIEGGEPDIPVYKVIESLGPTNTRVYKVAVYFRDQRLETGTGHSIQEAEMDAASNALKAAKERFPQLDHQKRIIERNVKQQEPDSTSPVPSVNKKAKIDKSECKLSIGCNDTFSDLTDRRSSNTISVNQAFPAISSSLLNTSAINSAATTAATSTVIRPSFKSLQMPITLFNQNHHHQLFQNLTRTALNMNNSSSINSTHNLQKPPPGAIPLSNLLAAGGLTSASPTLHLQPLLALGTMDTGTRHFQPSSNFNNSFIANNSFANNGLQARWSHPSSTLVTPLMLMNSGFGNSASHMHYSMASKNLNNLMRGVNFGNTRTVHPAWKQQRNSVRQILTPNTAASAAAHLSSSSNIGASAANSDASSTSSSKPA